MKKYRFSAEYRTMSTILVAEEAFRRKIPVIPIDKTNYIQLGIGKNAVKLLGGIISDMAGSFMSDNKSLSKFLFKKLGFMAPEGKQTRNLKEALKYTKIIGFPLVTKPLDRAHGTGVFANLKNEEDLKKFYPLSLKESSSVIVEKFLKGEDHRIIVIDEKVVAVLWRIPARVFGDGKHTIKELVNEANKDPRRGKGNRKPMTFIKIDEEVIRVLKNKGITLESVPKKGKEIRLLQKANISMGGEGVDATDKIHPKIKDQSIKIASILKLPIAGIDVITTDISKPLEETGGGFLEMAGVPGIYPEMLPSEGKPRDTAGALVDYLFPQKRNAWVPVFLGKKIIKDQGTIEKYLNNAPKEITLEVNGKINIVQKPNLTVFAYLIDPALRKVIIN